MKTQRRKGSPIYLQIRREDVTRARHELQLEHDGVLSRLRTVVDVGHAVVVEVQEGEDGVLGSPRQVDVQAASGGGRDHVEVHAGFPYAVLEEGEGKGA